MSKKVTIRPSEKFFQVDEGESILDAALRQDFSLAYSCRDGLCGTCKCKLLEGQVYYSDDKLPKALDEKEFKAGWNLLCQAKAKTDLVFEAQEIDAIKGIKVKTLPCRVVKMQQYAHDVMALFLKVPQNQQFNFLAGQYIDILLRDGRHRSYSIANPPHDNETIQLHIRHVANGAFSDFVFSDLKEKAILRFKGPLGTFFLREENEDQNIIFMAGGTGFAPIKGLMEHLFTTHQKQNIYLYWGVQAKRDLYLPDLPEKWCQQHPNLKFIPVLSESLPEDNWNGRTGYVTQAIADDFKDLSAYSIYAAGPPVMIESGKDLLYPKGLREDHYYYDSFEFAKD